MQPVVGVIADRSRSKWGRRRPFMVGGALLVTLGLLILGWTKEIVDIFISNPSTAKGATIALAVISIYAVDFAINAVQSTSRSLIVDTLPIPEQQQGSAWDPKASRMISVGSLLGYAVGTIDLVKVFGTTFGDTQFKQVVVIACLILLGSQAVTCYAVEERVLISARDDGSKSGAIQILTQLVKTAMNLPPRIRGICWAQFWAWIGWFPFLFYSTTWVGETYFRYDAPATSSPSSDHLGDLARIGSLSLVIFSIITFLASIFLPSLIRSPKPGSSRPFTPRPPPKIAPLLHFLRKCKPDLLTAWMTGHLMFAFAMAFAPFVKSFRFATVVVSFCGIPWTLACWAPFTFMGEEINRLSASNDPSYHPLNSLSRNGAIDGAVNSIEMSSHEALHVRHSSTESFSGPDSDPASTGELAGLYLGILNLFTTLPQFVGTFISSIVFWLLEPGKGLAHPDHEETLPDEEKGTGGQGIGVCLFIGAVCAVIAAVMTRRLKTLGVGN
ncbi:MAG: hypothetical protein M1834_004610 [Cirrosporium novae-zelandiae]|nr:MAG: hypothetical protein M1834_004610 [Cirrosporium novae-zelandiae]